MPLLALLFACGVNTPAPQPPAPATPEAVEAVETVDASAPAPSSAAEVAAESTADPACVDACMRRRMAEAIAGDVIAAECARECQGGATISDASQIPLRAGQRVTVQGRLERPPLVKVDGQGTALILQDDTAVWLTYGEPPHGWEGLVGKHLRVEGNLWEGPPDDVSLTGVWLDAPHLSNFDAPLPVEASPLERTLE